MKSEWINHSSGFKMTLSADKKERLIKFVFEKPVESFTMDAPGARVFADNLLKLAKELEAP